MKHFYSTDLKNIHIKSYFQAFQSIYSKSLFNLIFCANWVK
uniref:Uncharacterized protein n=1 Tax=Anguilla anguilla TaxID=7936 RepID=A0A0E9UP63_ANGAN